MAKMEEKTKMAKPQLEQVLKTLEGVTDWTFQKKIKDDLTDATRHIYSTTIGDAKYTVERKSEKFVPVTDMDRRDLDRGVVKSDATYYWLRVIASGRVRAVYNSIENPAISELYQKIAGARQ